MKWLPTKEWCIISITEYGTYNIPGLLFYTERGAKNCVKEMNYCAILDRSRMRYVHGRVQWVKR